MTAPGMQDMQAPEAEGDTTRVIIVSPQFSGKTALARHRLVYDTLRELMHKHIHALSVKAYTPEESDLIH